MSSESKAFSTARLLANLSVPLYRNAYAWMVSTSVSSALGIVYWIVAARYYSAEVVGLSTASISAMIFLSGVAQLNLTSALVRYIPRAGRATGRFILIAYLIPICLLLGLGVIWLRSSPVPALTNIFPGADPRSATWFLAATLIWSVFMLQDSVLTGLRDAVWVPIENISYAVVKIGLLVVFARLFPDHGIFLSWILPVVVWILPVNLLIFRRLVPRHVRATSAQALPLAPAQIARYLAGNYAGALAFLASTRLLPVLVTGQAGAEAGAYFFLSWMIANTIKLITTQMAMSFTVEGSHNADELRAKAMRFLKTILGIFLPLILLLVLAAPYILRLLGSRYSSEGSTVLRLLALSMIPGFVTLIYISVSQVRNNVTRIFIIQGGLCVLMLGLSLVLLKIYGIVGVGIAVLASETLVAAVLLLTQLPPLTKLSIRWKRPSS